MRPCDFGSFELTISRSFGGARYHYIKTRKVLKNSNWIYAKSPVPRVNLNERKLFYLNWTYAKSSVPRVNLNERKLFYLKERYLNGTLREEKQFVAGQIWSGDGGVLRKSSKGKVALATLKEEKQFAAGQIWFGDGGALRKSSKD